MGRKSGYGYTRVVCCLSNERPNYNHNTTYGEYYMVVLVLVLGLIRFDSEEDDFVEDKMEAVQVHDWKRMGLN